MLHPLNQGGDAGRRRMDFELGPESPQLLVATDRCAPHGGKRANLQFIEPLRALRDRLRRVKRVQAAEPAREGGAAIPQDSQGSRCEPLQA